MTQASILGKLEKEKQIKHNIKKKNRNNNTAEITVIENRKKMMKPKAGSLKKINYN